MRLDEDTTMQLLEAAEAALDFHGGATDEATRSKLQSAVSKAKNGQHIAQPQDVLGHCPMGCGATLYVTNAGYITCAYMACPNPVAVAQILQDAEHEHLVTFSVDGYAMKHPLRERLDNELLSCKEGEWIDENGLEMYERLDDGVFRMTWNGDPDYGFEKVS